MNVLIVGATGDPHITRVADALRSIGADVFVFDRYAGHALSIAVSCHGTQCRLRNNDGTVNLASIDAIWWRPKPMTREDVNNNYADESQGFVAREWRSALDNLANALRDGIKWVNPFHNQRRASSKILQLRVAQDAGFIIPDTCLTNDARDVAALFGTADSTIYKPQNPVFLSNNEFVFTSAISREDVLLGVASIAVTPGIYQPLVPKNYELRVTIVEKEVFAVRVDAPNDGLSEVDWRHAQFRDIFSVSELDARTERRLLAVHRTLGLSFATYDLIVTGDDSVVFLECNPGGQWLWLEDKLNLPISRSLAGALSR